MTTLHIKNIMPVKSKGHKVWYGVKFGVVTVANRKIEFT